MRRWLNENGAVVTVLALGLMVFSLFAIARQTRPRVYEPVPTHGYYADPATGEIFSALITEDPLPVAPSGQQAWRVHVFSCGNCDSESERFVGWVERMELREGPPGFRPGASPMTAPGASPAPLTPETSATTDPLAPPSPASPLATATGDPAPSTASPAAAVDATHSATPTTPDAGQGRPTAQAGPGNAPGANFPGTGSPGVGNPGFPRGPGGFGGGPGGWPRYRRFVRRPDDTQWVRARSEDGAVIMAAPQERCGPESTATPCLPPQPKGSR